MQELLLLKHGRVVYQGMAAKIVKYMEDIGIKVDHRMNPADFFMMEVSDFKALKATVVDRITEMNS